MNWNKFADALRSWGIRCAQTAKEIEIERSPCNAATLALINRKLLEGNIAVMLHHCIKAGLEK